MATLLGKATGGSSLSIPVDVPIPADGVLQLVYGIFWKGNPDAPTGAVNAASDTSAKPYNTFAENGDPLIGRTGDSYGVAPYPVINLGSACRACTAGDLAAGDTADITFDVGTTPQSVAPYAPAPSGFVSAGLLVFIPNVLYAAAKQSGGIEYNNGDGFPSAYKGSPAPATYDKLSWPADFTVSTESDTSCLMVTAMAANPSTLGFAPAVGILVGEVGAGDVSIACAVANVAGTTSPDPGGQWGAPASYLEGNYQYIAVPPAGARFIKQT